MAERAPRIYALVAEFDRPDALLAAARRAREDGFSRIEAFSPFPVDGLDEALGLNSPAIPRAMLFGAILGAVGGFAMQAWISLDFPLNIGGRPIVAWQAFVLVTFELMVLGAVTAGILAMLIVNRLPRLNHPLFEIPEFHLASDDKFFLALLADAPDFDAGRARRFLQGLRPLRLAEAPLTEPEA